MSSCALDDSVDVEFKPARKRLLIKNAVDKPFLPSDSSTSVGRLFAVTSERKVGVLPEPDANLDASAYLATGSVFSVVDECMASADGRRYYKLANGSGWVPQYSRKDTNKEIVAEITSQASHAAPVPLGVNEDLSRLMSTPLEDETQRSKINTESTCGTSTPPRRHRSRTPQTPVKRQKTPPRKRRSRTPQTPIKRQKTPPTKRRSRSPQTPMKRQSKKRPLGNVQELLGAEKEKEAPRPELCPKRLTVFTKLVGRAFGRRRCQELPWEDLMEDLRVGMLDDANTPPFSQEDRREHLLKPSNSDVSYDDLDPALIHLIE